MSIGIKLKCQILGALLWILPLYLVSQSNNYWQRSFNEESSLLSGAVVGGGAGPSAIYYNPAIISEITNSKFTLNASLFSFDFLNIKNAIGNGIPLKSSTFLLQPRFISYMIKFKKLPSWSFEIAFLNNENTKIELVNSVDDKIDILKQIPGSERYFAIYQYNSNYRDDWFGFGGSVDLSNKLSLGVGLFLTVKSFNYFNQINIEAVSVYDSTNKNNEIIPSYTATFNENVNLKFNDYSLLFKAGALYKAKSLSLGIGFTTPTIGVYSDGKRVTHSERRNNITDPESGDPLPNYAISDYQEKKNVNVLQKTPFSLSAGLTYKFPGEGQTLYTSVEYFSAIEPYRMVEANESSYLNGYLFPGNSVFNEWLTFVNGANPIFNAAIGYSWTLKKDLLLMGGFRTDFNHQKELDYGSYDDLARLRGSHVDLYHLSGGLAWRVFGQDIITGLEYTLGQNNNQTQLVNFSDPVEFNTIENKPLQGTRQNNVKTEYNSISIYFGASFNFGGKIGDD
ncbi:MAG: hypothetical protein KQI35_16935 [Bacteroidetes bacterium]|nr:hypothetical protein [Bacteroidota bacterium]